MEEAEIVLAVSLGEYESLRAEVVSRSGAQSTVIHLMATGSAALLAFALGGAGRAPVLLLLPLLGTVLGLLWLDHHRAIAGLGKYIATTLRSQIEPHAGEAVLRWEEHNAIAICADAGGRRWWIGPQFLVFGAPAVLGLIGAAPLVSDSWSEAGLIARSWPTGLWGLGAALFGLLLWRWSLALNTETLRERARAVRRSALDVTSNHAGPPPASRTREAGHPARALPRAFEAIAVTLSVLVLAQAALTWTHPTLPGWLIRPLVSALVALAFVAGLSGTWRRLIELALSVLAVAVFLQYLRVEEPSSLRPAVGFMAALALAAMLGRLYRRRSNRSEAEP